MPKFNRDNADERHLPVDDMSRRIDNLEASMQNQLMGKEAKES